MYIRLSEYSGTSTYECNNIRVFRDTSRRASDFLLLVTSEIRDTSESGSVRFVSNTQSRHHDQLAACFRCDKLCSCVRVLCCVYIYSCSSFIFITMDRKKVCKKSSANPEPGVSVEEEIISLGKSMGLEVEERDVNELIEEYTQENTKSYSHSSILRLCKKLVLRSQRRRLFLQVR
ncbi:hypothetical protein CDAR_388141 [Caerostris darwini]|uniref:Uncharacterized protein n=1 Tax=Caerostris darwini TaxID=1538125 RepID=A0AAV4VBT6_9ARAC|nr:hypothetical protein CDAR_388141 [Caerostris darwini]